MALHGTIAAGATLRNRHRGDRSLALLAWLAGLPACWAADTISIDFTGGGNNGTPVAMGVGESAGVVPRTNWTSLAAASGSASALVDDSGVPTTAAVSWSANSTWSTTITENAGNARMMKGYLDTSNTSTTTVTVSGLPGWLRRYDVYVYIDSDLGGSSSTGRYVLSAAPNSTIDNATSGEQNSGNFAGTFIPGNGVRGNHVVFRGVSGSAFTLLATPVGGSVPRAPVNGLQIVQPVFTHRPVALTGWTHDVVWENGGAPAAVNSDQANPGTNASTWFEEGVGGYDDGLPATRRFTSWSDTATQYRLEPYTGVNALRLNDGNPGTLTLARPGIYRTLRVLASSGSGGGAGSFVITFSDASTSAPIPFTATDWGGNTPVDGALTRLGRTTSTSAFVHQHNVDFNLYETRVDLSALGHDVKPIASLAFTKPGGAQATNVFAVSGESAGVRVDGVSPPVGIAAGGTAITITGAGFVDGATVTIGGLAAGAVTFTTSTQLTATTPAHASGPVAVVVTNPDGTGHVLDEGFIYLGPPPTISGITPASGSPFTTTDVTIAGANFIAPVSVTVAGVAASNVTYNGPGSISARFPAMSGSDATADVVVTSGDGQVATATNGFAWTVRAPDNPSGTLGGLAWRFHPVAGPLLPDFSTLVPQSTGTRDNATFEGFNPLAPLHGGNYWSAEFTGYVTVPTEGIWTFFTASDDGSRLYIGTTLVVANNFLQGVTERSGQIALAAGTHRLRVEYAQGDGGHGLYLRWQGPMVAKADIPDNAFRRDPTPTVSGINPVDGPQAGGTPATISGSGFVPGSLVAIGGVRAADAVVLSSTSISLSTPGGPLGAQDVLVIGPRSAGATRPAAFTYTTSPAPTVSAVSPTSGPGLGGTTVMLTVGNVSAVPTVTFNGVAATSVELLGPGSVRCVTPAMGGADALADIVVSLGGQSGTLADAFTYTLRAPENPTGTQIGMAYRYHQAVGAPLPLPDFAALSPNATGVRTTVAFNNNNPFEPTRPDNWSVDYRGYIEVPTDGVYTFFTASDDGSRLYIGDTLVVENNFYQGATERSGTIALAAGRHTARITFAQGGGGYELIVRYQGPGLDKQEIPPEAFTTDPTPAPTGLDVASGPESGGTAVTISGSGFVSGATVTFGGTPASSVTVAPSGQEITCLTPSHVAGAVAVVVTNPTGVSGTLTPSPAFTYVVSTSPDLVSVSPPTGSVVGGTEVVLTGTAFAAPMTVTFGGVAATNVRVDSDTSMRVLTPAHTGTVLTVDVVITNGASQSDTLVGGFTYTLRQPENPTNTQPGLTYRYHRVVGQGTPLPDFNALTPDLIEVIAGPSFNGNNPIQNGYNDNWSVDYRGYVEVDNDGIYTFYTASDDGSRLYIGNTLVVDNNLFQGVTERSGSIGLAAGRHAVRITFGQGGGGYGLFVRYEGPMLGKTDIDNSAFSTDARPVLDDVAPANGPIAGGTPITITGSGFTTGTTVRIGGTLAGTVVVAPDGLSLTAVTPTGTVGPATVTVANGVGLPAATVDSFLYQAPFPTISAVSPQVGPLAGGTEVFITGSGFQPGVTVSVGGNPATNVSLVGSIITARTPTSVVQGPVDVVVTNLDSRSATRSPGFYYQGVAPGLGTITPVDGVRTATHPAIITGAAFRAGARVFIGGVEVAPVTVDSPTQLSFTIPLLPSLQGPVDVVVQNTDLQTATLTGGYNVIGPPPTITQLMPAFGPQTGGTTVRIDGSGYYAGVRVFFDGVEILAGNVTRTGSTRLDVVTPAMPTQGPVDVEVRNTDLGSATLIAGFISQGPAPVVSVITPTIGARTATHTATIDGSDFRAGARVFIGGVEVAPVTVDSPTRLSFTIPLLPGLQGPVDVVVTNTDLQSGTLVDGYIVQGAAPQVTQVTPPNGPLAGGDAVMITGAGFLAGAQVFFDGVELAPGDVTVVGAGRIDVVTPPGTQGPSDVQVTNPDLLSATLTGGYTYLGSPPLIAGVTPAAAPTNVATTITISGSGFVAGVTVTIGGVPATVTGVTGGTVTATTPLGVAPGPAALVVTNIDGQNTTFGTFVIQGPAPILTGIDVPHGPVAGGRLITLTGSAFRTGATVTLGGVAAGHVTVVSATTITALTPAHGAGPVTVTVTNDDLLSSSLVDAYTYYTENDDRTVGNGCGTGGGLAILILLGLGVAGVGAGRRGR